MDTFATGSYSFDVTDAGPPDGPVVILLHGFPEDRHSWSEVTPALNDAGYRTLAFDQRGYSPGARPKARRDYTLPLLSGDVLALADQAGAEHFHIVGHDWGAVVAWYLAANHASRVRTVTAMSVPHPRAMGAALLRSSQILHSWYMLFFQLPAVPERALSLGGGSMMSRSLRRSGLGAATAERLAARGSEPSAWRGPLNWYRALPWGIREPLGSVRVPALYIWGDGDQFVTRAAAERCADFVTGPYRFVPLAGVSHWIPEEEPERASALLLEHLCGHP